MIAVLVLSLVLSQGSTPPLQGPDRLDALREARVQLVGKQLRCAVCQGVSIADSPSSMARAQLDTVRELVTEGKTDPEIYDSFEESYGEWALMEPKKSGVTLGLWLAPIVMLVLGLLLIIGSTKNPAASGPTLEPVFSGDDSFAQVRADFET